MKNKVFYFWTVLVVTGIAVSSWFAYKNLFPKMDLTKKVVVEVKPAEPAVVAVPYVNNNAQINCDEQPEYKIWKRKLGKIVNDRYARHYQKKKFLKQIENWRKKFGLPFWLIVDEAEAEKHKIVYNKCRTLYSGKVRQVFVSQVLGNKTIQVLSKKGKLVKLPLKSSGVDVVIIDELNKKGVPFRSWLMPVEESGWFIKNNDLFLSFDIEGVWLKVTAKGKWSISSEDKKAVRLEKADPLVVPGCRVGEECFAAGKRYFKKY